MPGTSASRTCPLPTPCSTGDRRIPQLDDPILEDQKGYVYPPQLVLVLVPLTPLPADVAAVGVALGMLALLGLTLWLLGVRDVRCYAAALLWVPSLSGVLLSNLSIPLAFALAVLWRYRDAVWPPAFALGLSVSAKLLFWPMFVWMLVTRRIRAAALAIVIGLAVTTAAWAAIGFDGLAGYPDLLRRLSEIQAERSYSIVGHGCDARSGRERRSGADARRRGCAARRVRSSRAQGRRRALVHVRRRRDPRAQPDRVAALSRRAARSARDRATALLAHLATPGTALGEPANPDTPKGSRHSFPESLRPSCWSSCSPGHSRVGSPRGRRRELRDDVRLWCVRAPTPWRSSWIGHLASLVLLGVLPVLVDRRCSS